MTWSRRELLITAAAGSLLTAGPGQPAAAATRRWRGTALGARAEIAVAGANNELADQLIARARTEVRRLESVFSLHLSESAISRLNAQGYLEAPPFELVDLLTQARDIHAVTDGAFDPTIQPLWRHLHDLATGRTPQAALETARAAIGYENVRVSTSRIEFALPGMALTLNGIAQGYITDKIADIFRTAGLSCLASLGEQRGVGRIPDGNPWTTRVPGSNGGAGQEMSLSDKAVAVSDPTALRLGDAGHILDPRGSRHEIPTHRVAVRAERATEADGFSTALALMMPDETQRVTIASDLEVWRM